MIRPRSKERALRVAILMAGDFLIGWGAVAAVVALRRKWVLPPTTIALFAGSLVAALALSGFYQHRVTPRTRPSILTALVIQGALVAIGSAVLVRLLPRTALLAVPLFEAVALPLWRRLLRVIAPIRPRDTILLGDPHDIDRAIAGLQLISDQRIRVVDTDALIADQLQSGDGAIDVVRVTEKDRVARADRRDHAEEAAPKRKRDRFEERNGEERGSRKQPDEYGAADRDERALNDERGED